MDGGVEAPARGFDASEAEFFECSLKFLERYLHPLHNPVVGIPRCMLECQFQVVYCGEEFIEERFVAVVDQFFLFFRYPLPVILELGVEPQVSVVQLAAFVILPGMTFFRSTR